MRTVQTYTTHHPEALVLAVSLELAAASWKVALHDGRVIDGSRDGNSARFLNHACTPNCEAIETGDRIFIHALTGIRPDEELFIDYGLAIDGEMSEDIRAQYACHCGHSACRRSMLGT